MKLTTQLLGAVSSIALIAMSSTPALAEGTSAGDSIINNVSVSYQVGGVDQTDATASDTFTVDRRVNVNVEFIGGTQSTAPGQENAVLAFDVTNLSNDDVDLALTTALTGGTSANIDNFEIYLDTDGDRVLDASELAAGPVTFLDEVTEDETIEVLVVADISLDAVNGDTFDVVLTANAHEAGAAGLGAELTATPGANTTGVDTVLFDGAGATDAANQGDFSDTGDFLVSGANVIVTKTSRIISDPVNGTTDPKAIPGAVVEYCITVANAAGAATAENVRVTDDLPFDVTFITTDPIFVDADGDCTGGVNENGGDASFSAASGPSGEDQILASLPDINASITRSLYFQVTID